MAPTIFNVANVVLKVTLLGAVAVMFLFPDLPQFEAKSLTLRAVLYPLFAAVIPAGWLWRQMWRAPNASRTRDPYPVVVDVCWTWTFTLDIVSNDLNWYNAYEWWDDLIHVINAVPYMVVLTAAVLAAEQRGALRLGFWGAALVALATFTAFHSLWEMWEYGMDRFLGTRLQPGGMTEATENNLASIVGGVLAFGVLRWWRHHALGSLGNFECAAAAPLAAYWGRLLNREEERVLRRGVDDRAVALHLPAPDHAGGERAGQDGYCPPGGTRPEGARVP